MAGKLLVYYLGDDEAYFKTLQRDFKKFTRLDLDLRHVFESEESRIQSLFLKLYNEAPAAIFIDYSKATQDYLHLTRLLTRTPSDQRVFIVGLLDLLSPQEVLVESIATGVHFTHVKQADAFDVVFGLARLLMPTEKSQHGFATAKLKEELMAGVPAKVGYVEDEGVHFETDYPLSKGDRVSLKTHWNQSKVFPSQEIFVKATSKSNLFYQFKKNVDAEFLFVDEFHPPEGMSAVDVTDRQNDRQEHIRRFKKDFHRWLDDNRSRSLEKKAKVLIIDRAFTFYQDQKRTDKHPYTIRCVPFVRNYAEELDRLRPQVIAVSLEKEDVKDSKNNVEMLLKLVGELKARSDDLDPFLIIFNTPTSSQDFKGILSIEHIMATPSEFSVDVLVKMAEIFEKKLNKDASKHSKDHQKVFVKKTHAASNAEIMIPITITKISETDLTFETEYPIQEGFNLHMSEPVNMHIHVLPSKGAGKIPEFYGLIHAIGEEDKKELRRFVNSVFFREHDAKLSEESEVFKKLNELKLQQKIEAEKKASEAAAAAAAKKEDSEKKGA